MTTLLSLTRAVERFLVTWNEDDLLRLCGAVAAARVGLDDEPSRGRTEVCSRPWCGRRTRRSVTGSMPAPSCRAASSKIPIRCHERNTTMETLNERILAEAQARPQISIELMDTLLPATRPGIAAAFNFLVSSGELVTVGTPGHYRLRNAHPDPDTILMMLANNPRPMGELVRATWWRPELVRECGANLIAENLATVDRLNGELSCTQNGLRKINWPGVPPHPNGGPPPPPVSKSPHDTERRNRLADTFAPVVAACELNTPGAPWHPERIAQRAYELADAMLGAGV